MAKPTSYASRYRISHPAGLFGKGAEKPDPRSTSRDKRDERRRSSSRRRNSSAYVERGKESSSQEFADAKEEQSDGRFEQDKRARKETRDRERKHHVKQTFEDCVYVRCSQCKKEGTYVHANKEEIVPYDPAPSAPPCQTCFQSWPDPSSKEAKEILDELAEQGDEEFGRHRWVCRKCKSGTDLGEPK